MLLLVGVRWLAFVVSRCALRVVRFVTRLVVVWRVEGYVCCSLFVVHVLVIVC